MDIMKKKLEHYYIMETKIKHCDLVNTTKGRKYKNYKKKDLTNLILKYEAEGKDYNELQLESVRRFIFRFNKYDLLHMILNHYNQT